jgi:hypothetical protein
MIYAERYRKKPAFNERVPLILPAGFQVILRLNDLHTLPLDLFKGIFQGSIHHLSS